MFKVGDRVRVVSEDIFSSLIGEVGVVRAVKSGCRGNMTLVQLDDYTEGHEGNGYVRDANDNYVDDLDDVPTGSCWYFFDEDMEAE